ncbi:hypothetical protein [Salinibacillus xinjiangensis]|uniref:DUF5668 domain-containing protein n=1 Tax=Salinibacillus xinjiangensis TaxID=1229268 RepID=A0A6G1X967_9BACI|nr:hypothetical protein [Salinibacillus xinjiangensis]MRG87445.1 hypothetical protein [Salinibacillus xinjiangensis]
MREWRIGTFSMGILLLVLGITLLLSNFAGNIDLVQVALTWWPVVLITVGLEILLYLFISKEKLPFLKFDFLSIIFVTVIGFIGIGFYLLSSFGIVDQVKASISEEVQTGALPQIEYDLSDDIEKVVLITDYDQPEVLESDKGDLVIFGSYETSMENADNIAEEDIAQMVKTGNTLYVQLLRGDYQSGMFYKQTNFRPKVSIPASVEVEVTNDYERTASVYEEKAVH